jgi:hypothetical protein
MGVCDATGTLLPEISEADLSQLTWNGERHAKREMGSRVRSQSGAPHFGLSAEAGGEGAANDLAKSGWGVIFAPSVEKSVKEALEPLLAHRREAVGRALDDPKRILYKQFAGPTGFWTDDTAEKWLARRQVGFGPVEPLNGVPYYLLIVGSPEEIPFEFQYSLDSFWGVGRLHFETADEYRSYAERVVSYECSSTVAHTRNIALFSTEHDFDAATQSFVKNVSMPLQDRAGARGVLGSGQGFGLLAFVGKNACKENLRTILRGKIPQGPPAILFTGTHGLDLELEAPLQSEKRGALVCQDWKGYGSISADDYFAASDLPDDASVDGLIHFFFACYGAGYPRLDDFSYRAGSRRVISTRAAISRLPQKLLAQGALACLGHVERAWSYSYLTAKGDSQVSNFRNVIAGIALGNRLGNTTDQFNIRWNVMSSELLRCLEEKEHGADITPGEVASRWVARNDARNYILLGDPAVRLRVSDLTGAAP